MSIDNPDHHFLAGTGLGAGDVIGSGAEMAAEHAAGRLILRSILGRATGAPPRAWKSWPWAARHGAGYRGHVTYYESDGGGFVFAIGSITFGGSLRVDEKLQTIARNALHACLR